MEQTIQASAAFNFLRFVPFSELKVWDVKRQNNESMSFAFPVSKLSNFLKKAKISWVEIEDELEYPILGVRANGKGVYINRVAKGKELTMRRYQKSKSYHLFYCKVRTVNGQWGVVYPEFENSYGSSNMQYLEIDRNKIIPAFLELILRVKTITDQWDKNAIGADGRHFTLQTLLNLELPLPNITEQEEILTEFNAKMQEAERLKLEIEVLKKTYDDIFFTAFSIERPKPIVKMTGLQFVPFSTISRWDALSSNFVYTDTLKSSAFNLISLGVFAKFVSRSWSKKAHTDDTFNYIELGGVNPDLGIESYSTLDKKEAPSRATQTVKEGDLIIGTTRPYLKRFAIVQEEHNAFVCSSGFSVIEPTEEVNLFFLKYYLMSCFGEEQLSNNMSGALYPAITSKSLIEDIYIPDIDVEKQNEIANQILTINVKIKENYRKIDETKKEALTDFEAKIFKN